MKTELFQHNNATYHFGHARIIFIGILTLCCDPGGFTLAEVPTSITATSNTGSLGTNVTQSGTLYNITGGVRPDGGPNLFHSFGDFSIGRGDVANFLNTPVNGSLPFTENILARVTGGNVSAIFGTIQTSNFGNANLFLLNPAGFLFGPSATLNIGGTVAFTTADYLRLSDGVRFNAVPQSTVDTLLTAAPVSAFGFLGRSEAAITIQGGTLQVSEGKTLSFISGPHPDMADTGTTGLTNLTVTGGKLLAPNGLIHMATVAVPSEISIPTLSDTMSGSLESPSLDPAVVQIRSGEFILDHARIMTSSSSFQENGGAVSITASRVTLQDSAIFTQYSGDGTTTGAGGPVRITGTDSVTLARSSILTDTFFSNGNGGAINIQAPTVTLQDSRLFTGTFGGGHGGPVTLRDSTNVSVIRSQIDTSTANTMGNSGPVTISGETVKLDRANINTSTTNDLEDPRAGNANDIELSGSDVTITNSTDLNATASSPNTSSTGGHIRITGEDDIRIDSQSLVRTTTTSQANAGNIDLKGHRATISNSQLLAETLGQGNGGEITITSTNSIGLEFGSQVSTNSAFAIDNQGVAGHIELHTPQLSITGGSLLRSNTVGSGLGGTITVKGIGGPAQSITIDGPNSGIFTKTEGTGAGGTVNLSTRSLTIKDRGTISASTTGTGPSAAGGSIIVNATDHVTLTDGSSITASSGGPADAGKISINAGQQLDLLDHSSITTTTQSPEANGGNIDIRAIDRVRIVNSTISTSVKGAEGSGGNIFIDPNVVILEGSNVTAQAIGGAGGNITFVTPLFLADSASLISASSERGPSGTVTIQSPTSNLSGAVGQLVSKTSPPHVLLQNRCVAMAGGGQSTFLLAGRDALPTEPGGWLNSPVSTEHLTGEGTEQASDLMVQNRMPTLATHTNETHVFSLRRLTPAGFLVRTFATGSTGCPS